MKKIPLTQGKFALVDDEDFESLTRYNWHLTGGYAGAAIKQADGRYTRVRMHRLVLGAILGEEVDHGNRLDNRRHNLRICSKSENLRGYRRAKSKKSHSRFRGVTWCKRQRKFMAQIRVHLGYFKSERQAARAYDKKARELFGEFACPNFPL